MYYSKPFNSNYTEFVGYGTFEKLIWTSNEGNTIKNKTRK